MLRCTLCWELDKSCDNCKEAAGIKCTKPTLKCTKQYLNNKFEIGKEIPLVWLNDFKEWAYVDCSTVILLSRFKELDQFEVHES